MNSPLISVIIPAYNVEKTIKRCLCSINNQTYKNIELIVIDDGSTDKTLKIIKGLFNNQNNVKIYSVNHVGIAEVRNIGIEKSAGDYITFVDSDDTVDNDYIEYLYKLLITFHTRISSCQHKVIYKNDKQRDNVLSLKSSIWSSHDWIEKTLTRDKVDLSTWGKLYDKHIFDDIHFPTGRLFEDTATTYRLVLEVGNIAVGSASKYNYILKNSSITRSSFNKNKLDLLYETKKMNDNVVAIYPDLKDKASLRMSWASVSILNSILSSNDTRQYNVLIEDLKDNVISDKKIILSKMNNDNRLKLSLFILECGLQTYRIFLKMYTLMKQK